MPKFIVSQQLPPKFEGMEKGQKVFRARFEYVDTIEARNGEEAISKAKRLLPFLRAHRKSLASHPIVEEKHESAK